MEFVSVIFKASVVLYASGQSGGKNCAFGIDLSQDSRQFLSLSVVSWCSAAHLSKDRLVYTLVARAPA